MLENENLFESFPKMLTARLTKGGLCTANLSPGKIRIGSEWPCYLGFKPSLFFCSAILLARVSDQGQAGAGDGLVLVSE